MSAILVACPQKRDHAALSPFNSKIIFPDFDGTIFGQLLIGRIDSLPLHYHPENYLAYLHTLCDKYDVRFLLNTNDYPGALFTSILAQERGLAATSLAATLSCQHKYYARLLQKKYVPEATPNFALVKKDILIDIDQLDFPLFIKPVRGCLSVYAQVIPHRQALVEYLERVIIPESYLMPFNWAITKYSELAYDGSYFIAEELLKGRQVTLEGLVYNGVVTIIGIVDSYLHEGTLSFERFVFPSDLPHSVQERMGKIAKKIMKHIGFNHNLFNIEFMYNTATDAIHIIEINPRLSAQFSDLYEMVHGQTNYQLLYDIVQNKKPRIQKKGRFNLSASLVCREWKDQRIKKAPMQADLQKTQQRFPELRYYPWMNKGEKLSDVIQDGTSYVYCWIHLGAQNVQELNEKYEEAKQLLSYEFEPI